MRNIRHLPALKLEDLDMDNSTFQFEHTLGDYFVYSQEGCSHLIYVVDSSVAAARKPAVWEQLDMRTEEGRARMVELCLVAA